MPGGDRTGPLGLGPMTGRAAGYCAGYSMPGFLNPWGGRGFGGRGGRGGGRGWRHRFYATGWPGWQRAAYGYPAWEVPMPYGPPPQGPYAPAPSPEQEIEALEAEMLSTVLPRPAEMDADFDEVEQEMD